jgi:hypothetical protein
MERINPAGWNGVPSGGLENNRAMSPPTIEPTIPNKVVMRNPICVCMMALAIAPAMKPIMIDQIICNIGGLFRMCVPLSYGVVFKIHQSSIKFLTSRFSYVFRAAIRSPSNSFSSNSNGIAPVPALVCPVPIFQSPILVSRNLDEISRGSRSLALPLARKSYERFAS